MWAPIVLAFYIGYYIYQVILWLQNGRIFILEEPLQITKNINEKIFHHLKLSPNYVMLILGIKLLTNEQYFWLHFNSQHQRINQ